MKLVSPKTLLASLLGCAFVVIKVMRFDGFPDLFWIIFIGYMSIKGLVTVVNLAQVLGLFSAFLFILVLTFTDEKWQLWIQLAHFVILLVSSVLAARAYGMIGFAWASLGANSLRVAAVIILGLLKAGKDKGGSNADR